MRASWYSDSSGGVECRGAVGPRASVRGLLAGARDVAMRVLQLLGVEFGRVDERRRWHQSVASAGRTGADLDHINLQGVNPLVGANEDDFGPRFPDMTEAYCERYREIAQSDGA